MPRASLFVVLLLATFGTPSNAHAPLAERAPIQHHAGLNKRQSVIPGILNPSTTADVPPVVTTTPAAVGPVVTTDPAVVTTVPPPAVTTTTAGVPPPVVTTTLPGIIIPTTTGLPILTSSLPLIPTIPSIIPTTTSSPSPSRTTRESAIVVTVTSIVTNEDGSMSTATSLQETSSPQQGGGGGGSGKTWGIVGGVVGGIVVLAVVLFIVWRCTQRRFSDLDADGDEIKWPELQPDGQAPVSTLNPMGTRRTGGAGIEMGGDREKDEWDANTSGGSLGDRRSWYDAGAGGAAAASTDHLVPQYAPPQAGVFYDPYLGRPTTPHAAPHGLYPPSPSPGLQQRPFSPPQYYSQDGHSAYSSDLGNANLALQGEGIDRRASPAL